MKSSEQNTRVLIVGAGGHGQVIADMISCTDRIHLLGYLDDDSSLIGKKISGVPVLGGTRDRVRFSHDALIIAIGDNRKRAMMFDKLLEDGEDFLTAVHPWTQISSHAVMGSGSIICAGSIVGTHSILGSNVILNHGCSIDHHNVIENHAHIAPGVHLGGEVTVREGALIGIGANVMPGCTVGKWSIVGGGALVTKDVPDGVVVVGVPARVSEKAEDLHKSSDKH